MFAGTGPAAVAASAASRELPMADPLNLEQWRRQQLGIKLKVSLLEKLLEILFDLVRQ